jgi:hypothetical protein
MLYFSNTNNDLPPVCLAKIRNYVELRNPRVANIKGNPIICWDRGSDLTGKTIKLMSLNDPESEVREYPLDPLKHFKGKEGNRYEGIIIDKALPNGVYQIEIIENDEGFFFEEIGRNIIDSYEKERILNVHSHQQIEEIFQKEDNSLCEWLAASIMAMQRKEWLKSAANQIQRQIEKQKLSYDSVECTPLLVTLLLATNQKSNLDDEVKEIVSEICECINQWCITDFDRGKILKYLVENEITDCDCHLMIEVLQLYLFKNDGSMLLDRQCMQRLWELNENIAVLANIRRCTVNVITDLLRVANYINPEVLEKIIRFKPVPGCETSYWFNCFENVLSGKCQCEYIKIECSKQLWGDGAEWSKLFTKTKNDYKIIPPDDSHSDGYEIMGTNYLSLIYRFLTSTNEESDEEKNAISDAFRLENLLSKYNPLIFDLHSVLKNRTGDGAGNRHRFFYLIGTAAVLEALGSSGKINCHDLRELLPFWKNAIKVFPKLVFRDLITAELSMILSKERNK